MNIKWLLLFVCLFFGSYANAISTQHVPDTNYLYKHQIALPATHSQINDLLVDSSGSVYIIYTNNVVKYDGERYKNLHKVDLVHSDFVRGGVYNDRLYFYDYSGRFFYCEEDSIFAYPYNDLLVEYNPFHELIDFKFDSVGRLHVSYVNSSYIIIDEEGNLSKPLIEKGIQPSGYICLLNENQDPFFIGSLASINLPKDTFYLYDASFKLVDKAAVLRRFYKLPTSGVRLNDQYYFSTGNGQLVNFSKDGIEKIENVDYKIARMFSSGRNLWMSVFGVGVIQFSDSITKGDESIALFPGKYIIASSRDFDFNCWAYDPDGRIFQLGSNPPFYIPQLNRSLNKKWISSIDLADSLLLICSRDSLFQIALKQNKTSLKTLKLPPSKNRLPKIVSNKDLIYLSYRGELYSKLLHEEDWHKVRLPKEIFSFHHANIIYLYRLDIEGEMMVFGVHNRYLFIISDKDNVRAFAPFKKNIVDVLAIKEKIVIQTEDDLLIHMDHGFKSLIESYPALEDKQLELASMGGALWISSMNEGLFKYDLKELVEVKCDGKSITNGQLITRDQNDLLIISDQGLISIKNRPHFDSVQINAHPQIQYFNSSLFGSNEDILAWTSLEGGLLFKSFEDLYRPIKESPPLKIELLVDGYGKSVKDKKIDPFHNFLQITFISQLLSGDISYRYRIPGFIDEWQLTDQHTVQIAKMNSGEFTLEAQQRKNEQEWSEPSYYMFEVGVPFYRTWWFITAILLLALLSVRVFIKRRLAFQNLQKEHELDRLRAEQLLLRSQMSPHFISNVLSSLHYFILKKMNKEADKFLSSFSLFMRSTYQYTRQEKVNLKDELKFIDEYLNLQNLRLQGDLEYSIDYGELDTENISIPTFILQPIVENAIHHGLKGVIGNKRVEVWINKLSTGEMEIKILDNGFGFSKNLEMIKKEKQVKSSLFVIEERLEIINRRKEGNLGIDKVERNGEDFTVVSLRILSKNL